MKSKNNAGKIKCMISGNPTNYKDLLKMSFWGTHTPQKVPTRQATFNSIQDPNFAKRVRHYKVQFN